jgi:hypothetical protein
VTADKPWGDLDGIDHLIGGIAIGKVLIGEDVRYLVHRDGDLPIPELIGMLRLIERDLTQEWEQ